MSRNTKWRVTKDGCYVVDGPESMSNPPRTICCSPSPHTWSEDTAKLIASAPTLRAERDALLEALEDAEFLMRKAGKYPGPMQDSFNRSAEDARAAIAKVRK